MAIGELLSAPQVVIDRIFYVFNLPKHIFFNLLFKRTLAKAHRLLHSLVHLLVLLALLHLHLAKAAELRLDLNHSGDGWPDNLVDYLSCLLLTPVVVHHWLLNVVELHLFFEFGAPGLEFGEGVPILFYVLACSY